jgi:hypothetical protein
MEKGCTYHVLYDAYASADKIINIWAGKDGDPWTSYSGSHLDTMTTVKTRYDFPFTMNHPTDPKGRLVFDVGLSTPDLHFDNMVLIKEVNAVGVESVPLSGPQNLSLSNYPNPFNAATRIQYQLPYNCRARLAVYDLLGHELKELVNESKTLGLHETRFNAGDLPSGIYFYKLTAIGADGKNYQLTKKLMLMK